MDKIQLRNRLFSIRSGVICKADKDTAIKNAVLDMILSCGFRSVFTYVSMGCEVDTKAIVRALYGRVKLYVPYTDRAGMRVMPLLGADELFPDKLGNVVSVSPAPCADKPDAVLVPVLGFNDGLYRIGYGGGYYDRYLADCTALKIGLAYSEQEIAFDPEPHDVPLDCIVTPESRLRRKHG